MERILSNVRADGLDPAKITKIVLTHYHMDHAGGAAQFRDRLGVDIVAPAEAAERLCARVTNAPWRSTWRRPPAFTQWTTASNRSMSRVEVKEGDRVPVGSLELEVFETPGHCDGHVSYLLRGREKTYLFVGDAVFSGGRIVLQNIHDCSIQKSAASVAKLRELDFDALLPGHAAICLAGGMQHVASAHAAFKASSCPRTLSAEPRSYGMRVISS